jgi:hypothetical protein
MKKIILLQGEIHVMAKKQQRALKKNPFVQTQLAYFNQT